MAALVLFILQRGHAVFLLEKVVEVVDALKAAFKNNVNDFEIGMHQQIHCIVQLSAIDKGGGSHAQVFFERAADVCLAKSGFLQDVIHSGNHVLRLGKTLCDYSQPWRQTAVFRLLLLMKKSRH